MHPRFRPALFASLALLAAVPAAAQLPSVPRVQLYGGLSLGPQSVPDELQSTCTPERFGALEARAGVKSGALALEVRGAVVGQLRGTTCMIAALPDAASSVGIPPDGVIDRRELGFRQEDPEASYDVRLRFGGTRAIPVVASVGAGRLEGPGVPYLLASVGVRTPGRFRLAIDLERDWYRVEYADVVQEWDEGTFVREISRDSRRTWWNGTGVRIGAELDLF